MFALLCGFWIELGNTMLPPVRGENCALIYFLCLAMNAAILGSATTEE